jgi:aminoglycoside/choline kinase family phosphotransferase
LNQDNRYKELEDWLSDSIDQPIKAILTASTDASFRRYFRIFTENRNTYIAVDAPPEYEDSVKFVNIASLMETMGIRVPEIILTNLQKGFLLIGDLGKKTMLNAIKGERTKREEFYGEAIEILFDIQNNGSKYVGDLPFYSKELLMDEMRLFVDWFCLRHLQIDPEIIADYGFEEIFEKLSESALRQNQVFVHRDFHSRNILLSKKGEMGVLDFQDAVVGPITYDLVSLLKDCYISLPSSKIDYWVDYYFSRLMDAELIDKNHQGFKLDFDLMGVQRHLKAVGIFSRLKYRDGKDSYILDIPRTIDYVSATAKQHSFLDPLYQFIHQYVY